MSLEDSITKEVSRILSLSWNVQDGQSVPSTDNIALAGGAKRFEATVLYADLSQSSKLATDFRQRTAAKIIRAFLYCMCRLIKEMHGEITSFDGDRVMGVFIGNTKNTNAATCALKMNFVLQRIIKPKLSQYFQSLRNEGFLISHCVGIDTSQVLVARAGPRGANDLVWIGRAPNLAAKLSEIREDDYTSFISEDVYSCLNESAIYGGDPKQCMWERRSFEFLDESIAVYRSNWWWSV